jgi:hypothetical protein
VRWWIISALIAALPHVLVAAGELPPPPRVRSEAIRVEANATRDFLGEVRLGSNALVFEETTLEQIRAMVGSGEVSRAGDASESQTWLCYSRPEELVWFASGEMGGSERLLAVSAERVVADDPRLRRCPAIPKNLEPVTSSFGWIGTTEEELRERLGEPSTAGDGRLVFYYVGKKKGRYGSPDDVRAQIVEFDVSAYLEVVIGNGKVISLQASHVMSN